MGGSIQCVPACRTTMGGSIQCVPACTHASLHMGRICAAPKALAATQAVRAVAWVSVCARQPRDSDSIAMKTQRRTGREYGGDSRSDGGGHFHASRKEEHRLAEQAFQVRKCMHAHAHARRIELCGRGLPPNRQGPVSVACRSKDGDLRAWLAA
eukprot:353707-Chlamydomonas_euryale.AAC.14